MPKMNSICVLMADGASKNGPVKILGLHLPVEACGHLLISGTNGEGKTSNIIEPILWLFDTSAGVKGRRIKDIYDPKKGRRMEMPYVFFLDWTLEAPAGEKLEVGCEHLLTGFVLDSKLTDTGNLRARFFHFTHGDDEYRRDWMETIRRHGLKAYEELDGNRFVPYAFDAISQDLKAAGARVFTTKEQRLFRESLEKEYGFFWLRPYVEVSKVSAGEENAVGDLKHNERFATDEALMKNLIIPMISTGIYDDEERAALARNLAECAEVDFKNQDTIARLEVLEKTIAAADSISVAAGRHSQASRAVLGALDSAFRASDGLDDTKHALVVERTDLEHEQAALGEQMTELKIKRLSYGIYMAEDRLGEAGSRRDVALLAVDDAKEKVDLLGEVVCRHDLVAAHSAYEGARGAMDGVRSRLDDLKGSEECKEVDNLSASIWKAYEGRIDGKLAEAAAFEDTSRMEAAAAAEARTGRAEAVERHGEARESMGSARALKSEKEAKIRSLLREAGLIDLFPRDAAPDIDAIDAKRVALASMASERDRAAESELQREVSLRDAAAAKASLIAEARVEAARLEAQLKTAVKRAEDLAARSAAVEERVGRAPRDAGDADAIRDSLQTEKAGLIRERDSARRRFDAVSGEYDRAMNSVGHVPAPIREWLDARGIPYSTGEKQIALLREQGVDVENLLSRCSWFPSIVIVPARVRDELLDAARAVGDIEGRGLSYLVTEDEVAGEFWNDRALDRLFGLFNRRLVIDRDGYIASLRREIERIDKRLDALGSAIVEKEEAVSTVDRLIAFIDGCERFDFEQIQKAPLLLDRAVQDKASEIDEAVRRREELLDEAERARIAAAGDAEEAGRAREVAGKLGDAADGCRRLEQMSAELLKKKVEVERLNALIGNYDGDILRHEAAASRALVEQRAIEKDVDALRSLQKGYTVFDPESHVFVEQELEGLVARHDALRGSLDKSWEDLSNELTEASEQTRCKKIEYDRRVKEYSVYGAVGDALNREAVTEAAYLQARSDHADAVVALSDRRGEAKAAEQAVSEKAEDSQRARRAFEKAYPDSEVVERSSLVDTDFDLAERRLDKRLASVRDGISRLGAQIRDVERASGELARARKDACALVNALTRHERPERAGDEAAVADPAGAIEAAGRSTAHLKQMVQAFRQSGQDRRLAAGMHTICNLADDGDAIKGADMYLMDPEKCCGLKDLLDATKEGCEYERISDEAVGDLARDRMDATKLIFISHVNALVTKGRDLEKLSGGIVRIDGLRNSSHKALPADDPGFDRYAVEWLSARKRRLVMAMEEAAGDPSRSGDPKTYAYSQAKSELFSRESLMEAWADYISASQPRGRQSGLHPQLKVPRGEHYTDWQNWQGISNSAGEISAATTHLFAALLCSIKPEQGKGGKRRDALGIPLIMDGPFRSVSDFNKISKIFELYGARNIQLIATSDDVSPSVSLSFPTEYRLFSKGSREETPLVCAECIRKENLMGSIAYIDENLPQRQLTLDL